MPSVSLVIGGSAFCIESTLWVFTLFFSPCFAHSYFFFAVFADLRNAAAVGVPLLPTLLIFSPDPALMRSCLARMFA